MAPFSEADRREKGCAVEWDLGLKGLGLLVVMSGAFGLIAHRIAGRRTTRWMWLIATTVFFVAGLFTSEVWFGGATEEDLQPNIDGLSFDEVLLFGLISGLAAVVLTRYVTRRSSRGTADSDRTHSHAG